MSNRRSQIKGRWMARQSFDIKGVGVIGCEGVLWGKLVSQQSLLNEVN